MPHRVLGLACFLLRNFILMPHDGSQSWLLRAAAGVAQRSRRRKEEGDAGEGLRTKEEGRGCEQGRQNSLWMASGSHTLGGGWGRAGMLTLSANSPTQAG